MKKTNKKYIIVALIALLAVGGIITYNSNMVLPPKEINNSAQKPIIESALARIDVSTTPHTEEALFFVSDENEKILQEAGWMPKWNSRGYVVQRNGNNNKFTIHANQDTDIKLALRGPDKRDENNQLIRVWVEYTSLKVNGEPIFAGNVTVWHSKPYNYTIHAKAGETYTVEATWQKPTEIPEE